MFGVFHKVMSLQFLPRLMALVFVQLSDSFNSIIFYSELFTKLNGIKDPVELDLK